MRDFETRPNLTSLHVSKVTFFPPPPANSGPGLKMPPGAFVATLDVEFWIKGEVILGPMNMSITPDLGLADVFEGGGTFIKGIETYIVSKLTGTSEEPVTKLPGIGHGDD